ncbi:sulfotransferase [Marinobacter sp. M216]|uniref:Sulfotransferase n=1 Tax=Marinobacter albus TaxID=3030833 RepID=A0ABT7HCS7_9GAMM|nr:sulfotransferase [Marinobacter sp. M216]MDK9557290.1 sulfotransferase [Marinobacter sp. M216]
MSVRDEKSVPDFLGIGAPRSGSTWLNNMLSRHPEIYVPPIKEVHYFDSVDTEITENFRIHTLLGRIKRVFISRVKHYAGFILSPFFNKFLEKAKPDINWDLHFFSPGGDINWYRNLFRHAASRKRLVGEITPAYIMLSENVIETVYDQTGVKKIIVFLRNPISATWSCIEKQVRDNGGSSRKNALFDDESVMRKIRSPRLFARYSYARNLSNWMKYYDRSQIFIGFYEELANDPTELLSRVFQFLDVDDISSQLIGRTDVPKVNAARGMLGEIPRNARVVLAEMHADQVEKLAGMIQGHAVLWHEEIEEILNDPSVAP